MKQSENPEIAYVEENGETTLYIDGKQVMQAWETDLMHKMADILCGYGTTFLEIGLGLGLSALSIARNPNTKRHVVIEKYQKVISLFKERNREIPETLEIINADIFKYVEKLQDSSYDGIFYDIAFPTDDMYDSSEVINYLLPNLFRVLKSGGAFMPFISQDAVIKEKYHRFANKFIIEKYPFKTYENTKYMMGLREGNAFIKCLIKE